jgi:hypothetical protein
MSAKLKRAHAFVKRTARAVKIVIGHGSIPRPIRWLGAFALLPVPGPFDEAVLLLVALILTAFYRARSEKPGLNQQLGRSARILIAPSAPSARRDWRDGAAAVSPIPPTTRSPTAGHDPSLRGRTDCERASSG